MTSPVDCRFRTARLEVAPWSLHAVRAEHGDLAPFVVDLLSERVTAQLPPAWGGPYDVARAAQWMGERDREATVLLVVALASREPVGLVILGEEPEPAAPARLRLHLGYLLAERFWGAGLASELLAGLVGWCVGQERVASLFAGVSPDNRASVRVLEKAGFVRTPGPQDAAERFYLLRC